MYDTEMGHSAWWILFVLEVWFNANSYVLLLKSLYAWLILVTVLLHCGIATFTPDLDLKKYLIKRSEYFFPHCY